MGFAYPSIYKLPEIEAYGLIGLFAVAQTLLTLLDMGMSPVVSREMARYTGGGRDAISIRNLLRSVEVALIIVLMLAFALNVSSHWFVELTIPETFQLRGFISFSNHGLHNSYGRFLESTYRSSLQVRSNKFYPTLSTP